MLDASGAHAALVETFLIAAGIGALTAGAARESRGRSAVLIGALTAGVSYVATHTVLVAWWFAANTLAQLSVGIDPAFIGFVEHALASLTGSEFVFASVAAAGGALVVVGRRTRRAWNCVATSRS